MLTVLVTVTLHPGAGVWTCRDSSTSRSGFGRSRMASYYQLMLSTDGYGTGEGQSFERPFGHADPAVLASWAGATAGSRSVYCAGWTRPSSSPRTTGA